MEGFDCYVYFLRVQRMMFHDDLFHQWVLFGVKRERE